MYVKQFAGLLTTASVLAIASAQEGVPADLTANFDTDSTELQASFDGNSADGFRSGITLDAAGTQQVATFALGDSSGVNTQIRYAIAMVDTTCDDARTLHYLKAGFGASGDKTGIESDDTPLIPYAGPGAFQETGSRTYTFFLFRQPRGFQPGDVPAAGSVIDVRQFGESMGFGEPRAGTAFKVELGGETNCGAGGAPPPPPPPPAETAAPPPPAETAAPPPPVETPPPPPPAPLPETPPPAWPTSYAWPVPTNMPWPPKPADYPAEMPWPQPPADWPVAAPAPAPLPETPPPAWPTSYAWPVPTTCVWPPKPTDFPAEMPWPQPPADWPVAPPPAPAPLPETAPPAWPSSYAWPVPSNMPWPPKPSDFPVDMPWPQPPAHWPTQTPAPPAPPAETSVAAPPPPPAETNVPAPPPVVPVPPPSETAPIASPVPSPPIFTGAAAAGTVASVAVVLGAGLVALFAF